MYNCGNCIYCEWDPAVLSSRCVCPDSEYYNGCLDPEDVEYLVCSCWDDGDVDWGWEE